MYIDIQRERKREGEREGERNMRLNLITSKKVESLNYSF